MYTAFYFFGAAADFFLSLTLWFVLRDNATPVLFADGDRVYAVTNVISVRQSVNIDGDEGTEFNDFDTEFGDDINKR